MNLTSEESVVSGDFGESAVGQNTTPNRKIGKKLMSVDSAGALTVG